MSSEPDGTTLAELRTAALQAEIERLRGLLRAPLCCHVGSVARKPYNPWPAPPVYKDYPAAPSPLDPGFKNLLKGWETKCARIEAYNNRVEQEAIRSHAEWHGRECAALPAAPKLSAAERIENAAMEVLAGLYLPINFPCARRARYQDGHLDLELELPAPDVVPRVVAERYVRSRKTFRKVLMKEKEFAGFYRAVLHQIFLRALYAIAMAEAGEKCRTISAVGYVMLREPAAGHDTRVEILTIERAGAGRLRSFDMARVDPEACFSSLGGKEKTLI